MSKLNKEEFRKSFLELLIDINNDMTPETQVNYSKAAIAPGDYYVLTPNILIKEVEIIENHSNKDYWLFAKFFTTMQSYHISACLHEDGKTYLGCTTSSRTPIAGEDWFRSRDLNDGNFNRRTWEGIKNDIIRRELVLLSDYIIDKNYKGDVKEVTEEKKSIEDLNDEDSKNLI